jgi:plastocyanin
MSTRTVSLVAVLAALALAAGGCGDDDDNGGGSGNGGSGSADSGGGGGGGGSDTEKQASSGGGGGGTELKLAADQSGALKFDKTSLSAKPGKVTIVMDNPSDVPHAIEVEGKGVEEEGEVVEKGGVSQVSADLKAGEYEFYCPVGNHKDAGMEGTLTVG